MEWVPAGSLGSTGGKGQARRVSLESGHSGLVNPKGCQRVAGGRWTYGASDLWVAAQEMSCTPEGVPDLHLGPFEQAQKPLWHPFRGASSQMRLSGGRSPLALNDRRLPSGNPTG